MKNFTIQFARRALRILAAIAVIVGATSDSVLGQRTDGPAQDRIRGATGRFANASDQSAATSPVGGYDRGTLAFAQPGPAMGRSQPGPSGRPPLPPFRPRGIVTHVPSTVGGQQGIAVSVIPPMKPRYESGAPVAISVAGGHGAGDVSSRMNVAGCGFIEIGFAFPGGGQDEARSGGTYDYRGPKCVKALRDVILFAMGEIADTRGRKIQDLVSDSPVLTSNVGLHGGSHGGNACGAVMGLHGQDFPTLAWYVSMESPYGEGAVGAELGARRGRLCPAYDPNTGVLDLTRLAFDSNSEIRPFGAGRFGDPSSPPLVGSLFFDMDGDGKCESADDYRLQPPVFDVGHGRKAWYSVRLMREAEKRGLLGDPRPAHIPTLAEAIEFWRYRDATGLVADAVRKVPNLAVIVVAGETDHVQIAADHPHIRAQVNAFQEAGAKFVRLNPDRAYVEWLYDREASGLPDNDAGLQYTPMTIQAALCPDRAAPKQLLSPAAMCELADRVQADNFEPNLDRLLFADAPKASGPPPSRRRRKPDREAPPPRSVRPADADPSQDKFGKQIDVVAAGPKFATEPVETNSNVGLEADTREEDYTLQPLPNGTELATLEFVSPGVGDSGHAAKITAEAAEAGILTRTIPADKGRKTTFSVKIRAEGIESVELVAVPLSRRPQRGRPVGFGTDKPRVQRSLRPFPPRKAGPRPRPGRAVERSKTLTGTFDWTTLSLDTTFTTNFDEAQFQVVVQGPGAVWMDDVSVKTHMPKIVDVPEKPLAPLYVMTMMHSETPRAYVIDRDYFRADAMKYEEMAKMLHRYGARLVIQPERELWLGAKQYDPDFLRRLREEYGASFSVHTHGPNPITSTDQDVLDYIQLRKLEMEAMGAGPVTDTNGNFERRDWDIFAQIGMRTVTSYKHPPTQLGLMDMQHYYLHPWRPSGSPFESEEKFARHNPDCGVVFLPGVGAEHTRNHELFPELIERHLRVALSRVRADRINVFYFVEHVGRFVPEGSRNSPWEYVNSQAFRNDLEQHERLYRDFLAPLVKSGHVRYAVPSEVCDLFEQWEHKMGIAK